MNETNSNVKVTTGKCKRCGHIGVKITDGFMNNGKNYRYLDENGRFWNGKVCPKCHQEEMKGRMGKKNKKPKVNMNPEDTTET